MLGDRDRSLQATGRGRHLDVSRTACRQSLFAVLLCPDVDQLDEADGADPELLEGIPVEGIPDGQQDQEVEPAGAPVADDHGADRRGVEVGRGLWVGETDHAAGEGRPTAPLGTSRRYLGCAASRNRQLVLHFEN